VAVVVGGHQPLAGGLAAVVEFLTDPVPQLAQQRVDVLGRRGDAQHPAQQGDVAQVGRDGLGDARVLDLDRDRAAVQGDRPVYLPDRGGGYRPRIPAGERPFRRRAEFFLHHRRGQRRAHRRDAVLEPGQGAADRGRQAVVDIAGHLADLHHDALHRPQGAGDVFGGLQRQVLSQQLALLTRGREQPRRAGRVADPAAREEPQRRPAAIKAQGSEPAAQQDQGQGRGRTARHRRGEEPPGLHAGRPVRIRRVIRCRASSTPGWLRNMASRTPSDCRISVRRPGDSGGAL
jgi:hypothetical protein